LLLEELFEAQGGKYASQAYWNALNKLRAAWKDVFGEDLPTVGNRAKDAFEQAIDQIKQRLSADAPGEKRLRDALDVDAKEDIAEVLLRYADMDDIAPKMVKQSMLEQCLRLGDGRHELRTLLRAVLDQVFAGAKTRRPRVGANRHWPRLLQYVRELEDDTDWTTGKGIHLMNAGGGGRVARAPADPGTLAIRIDTSHL
jgi:hypothetical protein